MLAHWRRSNTSVLLTILASKVLDASALALDTNSMSTSHTSRVARSLSLAERSLKAWITIADSIVANSTPIAAVDAVSNNLDAAIQASPAQVAIANAKQALAASIATVGTSCSQRSSHDNVTSSSSEALVAGTLAIDAHSSHVAALRTHVRVHSTIH